MHQFRHLKQSPANEPVPPSPHQRTYAAEHVHELMAAIWVWIIPGRQAYVRKCLHRTLPAAWDTPQTPERINLITALMALPDNAFLPLVMRLLPKEHTATRDEIWPVTNDPLVNLTTVDRVAIRAVQSAAVKLLGLPDTVKDPSTKTPVTATPGVSKRGPGW